MISRSPFLFVAAMRRSHTLPTIVLTICVTVISKPACGQSAASSGGDRKVVSVEEMIEARTDVWGDAAMREPNGASYEFFKDLMPPVRWVNAQFRHYPIVLSAPRAAQKTRLVSNGSAINARANKPPMWFEQGVPVKFFVGEKAEPFGDDVARLETPAYKDGYLPVVSIVYQSGGATYREEVFAPVDEDSAAHGVAMVRFSVATTGNGPGRVEARVDSKEPLKVSNRELRDEQGRMVLSFGPGWDWNRTRQSLVANLSRNQTADLTIATKPIEPGTKRAVLSYDEQLQTCIQQWKRLLERGVQLRTPESIVNDAWRSLVIGNLMIAVDDLPHYSAGNAYGPSQKSPRHLYEGECGDTTRSLVLFGQREVLPGMLKSMLEFNRKDTQVHVAGQKLQLLAYLYWLTRDAAMVRNLEPQWRPTVELILNNREKESGLLPPDRYAGDIATKVHSFNSNANCWRGLRDLAAVLEEIGSAEEGKKLRDFAADFRKSILQAVDRSIHKDTKPPYIPIALLAKEEPPDPLTSTEFGSYYDLICPYMIASEIFGQGSKHEDWLIGYLQNHGGIAMGMMRTERHQGENKGSKGMVPLYALRYNLALLRRDEREKALVAFYGQLAQGMTRGTYIGGEGNRFQFHGDADGREFVLPPNSTSNAAWLVTLRYLLIQDWDLDEDARPETLRLLFATPRSWLADGQQIRVDKAPTMFGPVSFQVASKLNEGFVEAQVTPPPRPAKKILLRTPLPAGWRVESVEVDGASASLVGGNVVDLTGRTKAVTVRFKVKRA